MAEETWTPVVGERVRVANGLNSEFGNIGHIEHVGAGEHLGWVGVRIPAARLHVMQTSDVEPAPRSVPPPHSASRERAEPLERWALRVIELHVIRRATVDDSKPELMVVPVGDAARISKARALCAEHPGVYPKEPGT